MTLVRCYAKNVAFTLFLFSLWSKKERKVTSVLPLRDTLEFLFEFWLPLYHLCFYVVSWIVTKYTKNCLCLQFCLKLDTYASTFFVRCTSPLTKNGSFYLGGYKNARIFCPCFLSHFLHSLWNLVVESKKVIRAKTGNIILLRPLNRNISSRSVSQLIALDTFLFNVLFVPGIQVYYYCSLSYLICLLPQVCPKWTTQRKLFLLLLLVFGQYIFCTVTGSCSNTSVEAL